MIAWIYELDVFQDEDKFLAGVIKRGYPCLYLTKDTTREEVNSFINQNKTVLYKGSFQGYERVRCQKVIVSEVTSYDCSSYYPFLHLFLHNKNYVTMFRSEAQNAMMGGRLNHLKDSQEGWFVRSDSSRKLFTGQRVQEPSFLDIIPADIRLVISTGENLTGTREFRFVVCREKIFSSSIYLDHTVQSVYGTPKEAFAFADMVRQAYDPNDPTGLWTVDVIEKRGTCSLVEINSFSFADLYEANWEEVFSFLEKRNFS